MKWIELVIPVCVSSSDGSFGKDEQPPVSGEVK
jgi:hypothetical protein